MKVLFVDDEEAVLSGIRRSLHHERCGWDVSFAVGGEAALARLHDEPFDVVVTDMRMPRVDGAAILQALHDERPATVRIVLSGQAEMATAMRTVPLAHQFVAKPCSARELRHTIELATGLQESLRRTGLLPIVGEVQTLPSPPGIVLELNRLLAVPDVNVQMVIDIVSQDPAICAKLLQMVNSAFFGLGQRVTDIAMAVRYLGLSTVQSLAVAVHAFEALQSDSNLLGVVDGVREHSLVVAELAHELVDDRRRAPDGYVAGLLHDIGQLLFASRATERWREVCAGHQPGANEITDLETEVFGANHAEVGAYFLSLWGLPHPLVEAVAGHHHARDLKGPMNPGDAVYVAQLAAVNRAAEVLAP
jgi:putative nucleotidyltransferase with HDIG domain